VLRIKQSTYLEIKSSLTMANSLYCTHSFNYQRIVLKKPSRQMIF